MSACKQIYKMSFHVTTTWVRECTLPSTQEVELGRSLSSRPAWDTQLDPTYKKIKINLIKDYSEIRIMSDI